MLDAMPHRFDFVDVGLIVDAGEDLLQHFVAFVQIAVVVDRFDDRGADGAVARRELREIQLPQQMIAQVFGFLILRLHAVGVVGRGAAAVVETVEAHFHFAVFDVGGNDFGFRARGFDRRFLAVPLTGSPPSSEFAGSSSSSSGLDSSASCSSISSSTLDSCSRRMACCNCGVSASCWLRRR